MSYKFQKYALVESTNLIAFEIVSDSASFMLIVSLTLTPSLMAFLNPHGRAKALGKYHHLNLLSWRNNVVVALVSQQKIQM